MRHIFTNALIFTDKGYVKGSFSVNNGVFGEIIADRSFDDASAGNTEDLADCPVVTDLNGRKVLPGLVDIHIHGADGADLSDGRVESIETIASYLAKHGVTSFTPTSMTLPYDTLAAAFEAARIFCETDRPGLSKLVGLHMEGPFFSEGKKGAQNGEFLKLPDIDGFKRLYELSGELIRIVDIAPELTGAEDFTREAKNFSTVSVAHTEAGYADAKRVFDAGATHLTHLFNAMPPIHHREPGVIGAASEREDVIAELICDGWHVHPSAIRMAFRLFPGRICLISDALRCLGMPDGEYELGGQTVSISRDAEKGGVARLSDGTLAGSCTDLFDCMKNAVRFGIPEEEAIRAASSIPAKCIAMDDRTGSIAKGKAADFLVCDDDLSLKQVYIDGVRID